MRARRIVAGRLGQYAEQADQLAQPDGITMQHLGLSTQSYAA